MWYCPKCSKHVTEITEVYNRVLEHRKWGGECYELIDSSLQEPDQVLCRECSTEVEGHEEE